MKTAQSRRVQREVRHSKALKNVGGRSWAARSSSGPVLQQSALTGSSSTSEGKDQGLWTKEGNQVCVL